MTTVASLAVQSFLLSASLAVLLELLFEFLEWYYNGANTK